MNLDEFQLNTLVQSYQMSLKAYKYVNFNDELKEHHKRYNNANKVNKRLRDEEKEDGEISATTTTKYKVHLYYTNKMTEVDIKHWLTKIGCVHLDLIQIELFRKTENRANLFIENRDDYLAIVRANNTDGIKVFEYIEK